MQTTVTIHCSEDTSGEERLRERQFTVNWIKEQLCLKTGRPEKEAFLSKHKYVVDYYGIKRDEILNY